MEPIYCQSKKLSRQSLFTLLYVQLFNIYFISKSFLLPFNQCLGVSYLILEVGLVVKASCCQIILYILHFARFAIPIFKINLAISTFGNILKNVEPKWFYFKQCSHNTKSVLMAIAFWQTKQTILNFFSCHKVSNILSMQHLHNTFLSIFFISDLIRYEKCVYYYLHIFHLL